MLFNPSVLYIINKMFCYYATLQKIQIVITIFIFNLCKNTIILLGWVQTTSASQNVSSFLQ